MTTRTIGESDIQGGRVGIGSIIRFPAGPRRLRGSHGEGRQAIWYLTPWGIGIVWLVVIPSALAIYWSFTDFNLFNSPRWVGFANYWHLFNDPVFIKSVTNTIFMAGIGVTAGTLMGLGSAVLLNRGGRLITAYRSMIFLPAVVPPVATGIAWTFILNPNYGILNAGLRAVGLPTIGWLSDPAFAKYGLLMMVLWGSIGQVMITFVAALQEVPADILEAASLDGAGRVRTFTNIVLPTLRPVLLYNIVIGTLFYFQFFEQAFVISPTNLGAPAQATLTYALYLYQQAFTYLSMGRAAAIRML